MGQWVMGHSFDGSHGSWVTARDPFAALGVVTHPPPGNDRAARRKYRVLPGDRFLQSTGKVCCVLYKLGP